MSKMKLFVNGKFFTANDQQLYAEEMLVKDGVILDIGTGLSVNGEECEKIDLGGLRVIPGIIDAHQHPVTLAEFAKRIAVLPPEIHSIEELQNAIKERRRTSHAGTWITGWGYDEGKLKENRTPNRQDLDIGCYDSPVMISRSCGHIIVVNSKALTLAGISAETPDPPGGEIDRDSKGVPTGILRENARLLVQNIAPQPTREDRINQIVDLGQILLSHGITSVCDMGSLSGCVDTFEYYEEAAKKGFKQRVGIYYFWEHLGEGIEPSIPEELFSKEKHIRINGIKMLGDGSFSGKTAWVNTPYLGEPLSWGMCTYDEKTFEEVLKYCKEKGCQMSMHAMGGRTIDKVVNRIKKEKKWNKGSEPAFRIEHVTEPSSEAVSTMAECGIGVSTQPIFFYSEIESYLKNLDEARVKKIYPVRTMLEKGVLLSLSTDAPATSWADPSNPFVCMKAAVTRRAYEGTDCGDAEAVDIETAIKLYTRNGGIIGGFNNAGMLRPGFTADFVVLTEDIISIPKEKIDEVNVKETYIAGECVYQNQL